LFGARLPLWAPRPSSAARVTTICFGQAGKDNLLAKNGGTGRDSGSWNKKDQAKSVEKRLR